MCMPNPTIAIVTFWQGIVEIILRVAVIVSLYILVIFACHWSALKKKKIIQQEQAELMGAAKFCTSSRAAAAELLSHVK